MTLVSLMSSAVSVSTFCRGNSQREERFADDGFQDVDQAVLQRMTRLSLSRDVPPDNEDDSSQGATDVVGSPDSTPSTPASESNTSIDIDANSLSDQLALLSPQPSLYSLTESLKEEAICCEFGRSVNTHSDVYKLAADEEEAQRLGKCIFDPTHAPSL